MTSAEVTEVDVRVTSGVVRGRIEDGLAVFRGIPFAAPPVGEARFAAPQPVAPWDGVRDAFAFGPPAPQEMMGMARDLERADSIKLPEGDDWLTVNVWTPDPDPATRRAVLVWIYGGAYKVGFSGSPGYDAQHIAREGDVVFVSLNYRLGIEGFAQIDGAPANRGLLDQAAALRWVRDNIAAFGGDPEQVTVFGESAGAGSIAALLAMPSASGLFRRAIMQSLPGTFFTPGLAADIADRIAAGIGRRATVADLSGVDPRELTAAGAALAGTLHEYLDRWGVVAHVASEFGPVVDGDVLPTTPWQALADGAARDVELIIGHNKDEYRLFVALFGQLGKVTDEQAAIALRVFGPGTDPESAYRAAYPDATAERLHELVKSDWLFRMPAIQLADAQRAGGGRVHVYELSWQTTGSGGEMGACHGMDGPLVFGTLSEHLGPLLFEPDSPEALALSKRMRSAWTAFARTGDPGWAEYDSERQLTWVLDTEPSVTAYPEQTSLALWRDHTFDVLDLTS